MRAQRRTQVAVIAAVVGPGLLAGLSDDDPAGITTYSVLGAEHGYRLLALAAVFVTYVVAGVAAHPRWGDALRGTVVPSLPHGRSALVIATATVGTTLAPWGLSFIQSYTADKRLTPHDLIYERTDVVTGAVLTGVIGFFVVVACAATLHAQGVAIHDAADAAQALEPVAGGLAAELFGAGLISAALLAASILPLSTAYSVSEFVGRESALDDTPSEAPLFYGTYAAIVVVRAAVVLVPGAPLVTILVATQVLNAVLLLPLLAFMYGVARDRELMGDHVASRSAAVGYLLTLALVAVCVGALALLSWV